MKLPTVFLYYITNRLLFPGDSAHQRKKLLENIAEAARCGIDFIQLREKDLSAHDSEGLAREVVAAMRSRTGHSAAADKRTRLLINSRVDVAIAVGADGVHLRSGVGELSASEARTIFHKSGNKKPVIAVSCHSTEEISRAEAHGTDFAVFGPVFEKVNAGEKRGSTGGVGLETLEEACSREASASSRMPVLALGGITFENAQSCLDAGAAGIAGIRVFQPEQLGDLQKAVRKLRTIEASRFAGTRRRHPYQSP